MLSNNNTAEKQWFQLPNEGILKWLLEQSSNSMHFNKENPVYMSTSSNPDGKGHHHHALFKTQMIYKDTDASAVFLYLMSNGSRTIEEFTNDDNNSSDLLPQDFEFCQIDRINDHEDVILLRHMQSLYIVPSWTEKRDYCLHRSWRVEKDGSYTIIFKPSMHRNCPLQQGYVRGEMYAKYRIISHQTEIMDGFLCNDNGGLECVLKQTIKVNPKGWIPSTRYFVDGQSLSFCDVYPLYILQEFVNFDKYNGCEMLEPDDRFVYPERASLSHQKTLEHLACFDSEIVINKKIDISEDVDKEILHTIPEIRNYKFVDVIPVLDKNMWSSTQASLWKVRGKHYISDRKKHKSDEAVFKLLAIDLVQVSKPILSGFCNHPSERVQKALSLEKEIGNDNVLPPFLIIMNLFIPGPPYYHLVMYFEVEKHTMNEIQGKVNTPFSKLASKFFFGDDDVFRDTVFKLFPRLEKGNFVVRSAVGSTPVLIGKRLKQYYYRTDRYFELVVDISSKPRAAGIIKLTKGFAKSLVVDIGFGLEGNEESELPEKIMACCRLHHISFDNVRYVLHPDDLSTI